MAFPPRDEVLAFFGRLNAKYRDEAKRPEIPGIHIDVEGVSVWVGEYLRRRDSGESPALAEASTFAMIDRTPGFRPTPPVLDPPVVGELPALHVEDNARWFAQRNGLRFDWREVTAFGLYALWLKDKAAVRAFWRAMASYGFTVQRVVFSLDNQFWRFFDRTVGPDDPRFWEELRPFLDEAASQGLYTRAVMIGDLGPFGGVPDWERRPDIFKSDVRRSAEDFCIAFVASLFDVPHVIFEIANEPIQIGMRDSLGAIVELGGRLRAVAPDRLFCGGAADGEDDQRVDLIRKPFDFCDAHIQRLMGMGGFQWVKRSGEYMPIDQPPPVDQRMPFVSGEPVNFGEDRLDGRRGDVEKSPAVAFCYAAVSRARQYNACFHYDGGLFGNLPKPETERCIRAFHQGLDAFPMSTANKWRGHWQESFFGRDIYPPSDDERAVLEHVTRNRGPWRVFGCGNYAVTIMEPAGWEYQRATLSSVVRVAYVSDGTYASGVYKGQ